MVRIVVVISSCLALLAFACSNGAPAQDAPARPRLGHGPDGVPPGDLGAHALPVGDPVAMPHGGDMPRDAIHGGGAAPNDAVHGGGGAPNDAVHGGGAAMPGTAEGMPEGGGAPLQWTAPPEWRSVTPSSSMRVAEWALPKAHGDAEDASLVVFHFPGMGGSVQANLDRWYGQFEQPDGRATADVARVSNRTVAEMRVTITDVTGTFSGGGMMGGPPSASKPDFRMIAAIVERPSGPWFFKLTGPRATVERWRASFETFVSSLRQ